MNKKGYTEPSASRCWFCIWNIKSPPGMNSITKKRRESDWKQECNPTRKGWLDAVSKTDFSVWIQSRSSSSAHIIFLTILIAKISPGELFLLQAIRGGCCLPVRLCSAWITLAYEPLPITVNKRKSSNPFPTKLPCNWCWVSDKLYVSNPVQFNFILLSSRAVCRRTVHTVDYLLLMAEVWSRWRVRIVPGLASARSFYEFVTLFMDKHPTCCTAQPSSSDTPDIIMTERTISSLICSLWFKIMPEHFVDFLPTTSTSAIDIF